jgi:hypothetical protein
MRRHFREARIEVKLPSSKRISFWRVESNFRHELVELGCAWILCADHCVRLLDLPQFGDRAVTIGEASANGCSKRPDGSGTQYRNQPPPTE